MSQSGIGLRGSRDRLTQRWTALWLRLGAIPPARAELAALLAHYGDSSRRYHGLAHLESCLALLDRARHVAPHPDEAELALWFHDAIYNPRASDNEVRSAEWAGRVAREAALAADIVTRVAELVRATTHESLPSDPDAQLVSDVDLAILGAAPAEFDAYERAIREEYSWVPAPTFRARRAEILERLLARPTIFATPFFRQEFEARARLNLTRSLAALRATEGPLA